MRTSGLKKAVGIKWSYGRFNDSTDFAIAVKHLDQVATSVTNHNLPLTVDWHANRKTQSIGTLRLPGPTVAHHILGLYCKHNRQRYFITALHVKTEAQIVGVAKRHLHNWSMTPLRLPGTKWGIDLPLWPGMRERGAVSRWWWHPRKDKSWGVVVCTYGNW